MAGLSDDSVSVSVIYGRANDASKYNGDTMNFILAWLALGAFGLAVTAFCMWRAPELIEEPANQNDDRTRSPCGDSVLKPIFIDGIHKIVRIPQVEDHLRLGWLP